MSRDIAYQHFLKARKYIQRKNYKAACFELHKGLANESTSYYGHRTLGYVAGKLRRYEEWAEERRYLLKGYGNFETGIDGFSKFVPRPNILLPSPDFSIVFSMLTDLGIAEFSFGIKTKSPTLLRQSLVYFDQILTYDPDYIWLNTMRAWCYVELNEYDVAEQLLKKDAKLFPNLIGSYLILSRLSYRRGQIIHAIVLYVKGWLAFFKDVDLNIKAKKSGFHFATEAEERQYFESRLLHPQSS